MIRFSYDAVLKTGVFSETLCVWRRKTIGLKTCTNFQVFMVEKYDDYKEDQAAKDHHPFAGAAIQADTLKALQNVVQAMIQDHEDIASLSNANLAYKHKILTMEGKLKTALKQIADLTTMVEILEEPIGRQRRKEAAT